MLAIDDMISASGRVSAECAFCSTALPLAEASMRHHNAPIVIQHRNRDTGHAWAA
jgi:hypothetical protein